MLLHNTTSLRTMAQELATKSTKELVDTIMNDTVERTLADAEELLDTVDTDSLLPLLQITDRKILLCVCAPFDEDEHFELVSEKDATSAYDAYEYAVAMCDALDEHSRKKGLGTVINSIRQTEASLTDAEITERIKQHFHDELVATLRSLMQNTIEDKFTAAVLDTVAERANIMLK